MLESRYSISLLAVHKISTYVGIEPSTRNFGPVHLWSRTQVFSTNIPTLIDSNYEIFQTISSKHQGVWIIVRKGWTQRWYTIKDSYMIVIQTKNQGKIHLVIGVYCKEITKEKILESLCKLLHRIEIKYINPIITEYGYFNTNKNFSIEMIEKRTKLMSVKTNEISVTRIQKRKKNYPAPLLIISWITEKLKNLKLWEKQTLITCLCQWV